MLLENPQLSMFWSTWCTGQSDKVLLEWLKKLVFKEALQYVDHSKKKQVDKTF